MDVVTLNEGFNHVGITTQMRHDTEFDLRVIGREKLTSWFRDKCLAYFPSVLVANWNVLQIRIRRGKATCSGNCLIIRGVDVSSFWIDKFGKVVDIGGKQFLITTIIEDFLHDWMPAAEVLKHFLRSDILSRFGLLCLLDNLEFSEEDVSHLTRGRDVKFLSCHLVDFLLDFVHLLAEIERRLFE